MAASKPSVPRASVLARMRGPVPGPFCASNSSLASHAARTLVTASVNGTTALPAT